MRTDVFSLRHIGPRPEEKEEMLKAIGAENIDQLIYETLPDGIKLKKALDLEPALSEYEYATHINALANKNKLFKGLPYLRKNVKTRKVEKLSF